MDEKIRHHRGGFEIMELKTLKEKELYIKNWFLKNELYSDGSNNYDWLSKLKKMIEDVWKINLTEEDLK